MDYKICDGNHATLISFVSSDWQMFLLFKLTSHNNLSSQKGIAAWRLYYINLYLFWPSAFGVPTYRMWIHTLQFTFSYTYIYIYIIRHLIKSRCKDLKTDNTCLSTLNKLSLKKQHCEQAVTWRRCSKRPLNNSLQ